MTCTNQLDLPKLDLLAEEPCSRILEIYTELKKQTSYAPSPTINALFSELVSLTLKPVPATSLTEELAAIKKQFQHICDLAETAMEIFWATKIANSKTPRKELLDFPYLSNYKKIASIEHSMIVNHKPSSSLKLLFIGSGALPLSVMNDFSSFRDICLLDINAEAITLSEQVLSATTENKTIRLVNKDVLDFQDIHQFDVVLLGALVGSEENKPRIIEHVADQMKENALLLIRSSHGLKQLLYPKIDISRLPNQLKVAGEYIPYNDLINSIIVAQKSK